ncbi:LysR family transcriptional regulator [Aquamicrobium sp. LC103]|uniref:LysR family transcriptional regulator n=1 Tax=Aquamicrobium sp. LC103 TaxID=1120658 RepID=UPI00063E9E12|nr:LysR family transcriptional regulator [Aquamicrobium sp. LC103]TKT79337.1 LysR family transcriptional regulator [Aquamicrobium sp. LC103]
MDRLDAMRLFTRVVERRSFTQAAQDLGIPRSTATQVIQQMENRLGVRLLQRTTRTVRPTLDGEAYHRRCIAILADIEDAEGAFVGSRPKGLLRVDVHGTLARHFLLPALPQFLEAYPGIELHMSEGDRLVDLVREGIDCVLRVGVPQDSDMIARRVAMLEEVTLAAPAYIERFGTPDDLDDLAGGHRMIGFHSDAAGGLLPLEFTTGGKIRNVTLPAAISVNAAESYVAAAKLGLGLIQVPRYHVEAALASRELVELLPGFPPAPTPVSLLYPTSRQLSPRVRLFIDWVIRQFRART